MARRTITPAVVVDGTVTAYPKAAFTTRAAGTPRLDVRPHTVVAPGQQLGTIDDTTLTATFSGTINALPAPAGARIPAGAPIAIATYAGMGASVTQPRASAYRSLGTPTAARASLQDGAEGFACTLADSADHIGTGADISQDAGSAPEPEGTAAADNDHADGTGRRIVCLIPRDIAAYPGQHIQVGLQYRTAVNVPALPTTAVAGSAQQGRVRLCNGTRPGRVVDVKLGVTDGSLIEITSGVKIGDTVCATPPELGES